MTPPYKLYIINNRELLKALQLEVISQEPFCMWGSVQFGSWGILSDNLCSILLSMPHLTNRSLVSRKVIFWEFLVHQGTKMTILPLLVSRRKLGQRLVDKGSTMQSVRNADFEARRAKKIFG